MTAATTSYVRCQFCHGIFEVGNGRIKGYITEYGNVCVTCYSGRGTATGGILNVFYTIQEKQLQKHLEMQGKKKSDQPLCNCGRAEIFPGEDLCHLCLGVERHSEIDEDYIGSEEWKEEIRYWWPKLFPKAPSTPDSPSEPIAGTTVV